jgi:hypothetical protein
MERARAASTAACAALIVGVAGEDGLDRLREGERPRRRVLGGRRRLEDREHQEG